VGLVTGACFAEFGNHVICVDKDADRIEALKNGKVPFFEPGLDELVERVTKAGRLEFSTDLSKSIRDSLVVFIAVGTPQSSDGSADLSFVMQVARSVAENLNGYKVVVTKSTVPAGTGREIRQVIQEGNTGVHGFSVASNPEFLREGSAIEDFMRPNRVVLGTEDEASAAILTDLYRPLYLLETPIVVTEIVTAEVIKYASNAFLATKISFINEMADLCEVVGADVHIVAKGMGLDKRIGPKFLHPGPGYGGSCFPKDTRAVAQLARDHDVDLRVVDAVIDCNEKRIETMMSKIRLAVSGTLEDQVVALLGLTFKPNTDDLRESPAVAILQGLLTSGSEVRVFDPAGMTDVFRAEHPEVRFCSDEYDAAAGADCLVIATEWNQFRGLDLERLKNELAEPVLVDLRNIFEPDTALAHGFSYVGIGR
jgi:UDPglucose 6-dehydrogenase